jgi:uncharacterized protein with GYD domain
MIARKSPAKEEDPPMGHYLVEGSYSGASAKAMVASPTDRSVQAKSLVESLGGKFHHFFFMLGDSDWMCLCEFPDDASVASMTMALGASGAFTKAKTTKLLTAQEAQSAMGKAQSAKYAPPIKA